MIASKEKQLSRLNTCMACPDIGKVPIINTAKCNVCHCPLRSKIFADGAKCPKGKW
jgi:hypothetical protein